MVNPLEIINKISIFWKILTVFLFFSVALMLSFSIVTFVYVQKSFEQQLLEDLSSQASSKEGHIYEYFTLLKSRGSNFASDGYIREHTRVIIEEGALMGKVKLKGYLKSFATYLAHDKMALDKTMYGINILNTKGIVVASTFLEEIGKDDSADEYFKNAVKNQQGQGYFEGLHVSNHFERKIPAFVSAAPLYDLEGKKKVGVINLYFTSDKLNTIINENLLPNSDEKKKESYLVDQDRLIITKLNSLKNLPFAKKINTKPVVGCGQKEKKEVNGIYPNYKNTVVLGATRCLTNGWVLIIEVDRSEALVFLAQLRDRIILVLLGSLATIFLFSYFFVKTFTSPLIRLAIVAKRIGEGDLSEPIVSRSSDEVGLLYKSFENMRVQLKSMLEKLNNNNKTLETQGLQLKEQLDLLEKFQKVAVGRELKMIELKKKLNELTVVKREKI